MLHGLNSRPCLENESEHRQRQDHRRYWEFCCSESIDSESIDRGVRQHTVRACAGRQHGETTVTGQTYLLCCFLYAMHRGSAAVWLTSGGLG